LQVKLAGLAKDISKPGLAVAMICFVANVIFWLYRMSEPVRDFPPLNSRP
jgi:hypothetical protein